MHLYLTARHMDLADDMRQYVQRRLVEPVGAHTSLKLGRMQVQLFREGDKGPFFGCHVLVEIKGKREINVREIDVTIFEAIDKAQVRIIRHLTDLHDEIVSQRRHPPDAR